MKRAASHGEVLVSATALERAKSDLFARDRSTSLPANLLPLRAAKPTPSESLVSTVSMSPRSPRSLGDFESHEEAHHEEEDPTFLNFADDLSIVVVQTPRSSQPTSRVSSPNTLRGPSRGVAVQNAVLESRLGVERPFYNSMHNLFVDTTIGDMQLIPVLEWYAEQVALFSMFLTLFLRACSAASMVRSQMVERLPASIKVNPIFDERERLAKHVADSVYKDELPDVEEVLKFIVTFFEAFQVRDAALCFAPFLTTCPPAARRARADHDGVH